MTVQSQGFYWWQKLMDRYQVQMYRRVTKVYLYGPQHKRDLLPHLSRFRELRELELHQTSIPRRDLEFWKQQHPQVAVTATHSVNTK